MTQTIIQPTQPTNTPDHRSARWPWVVGALILLGGGGYWATHRATKVEKKPPPTPAVLSALVARRPVPLEVQAIGNVEAHNSVQLRALATGEVTKVYFHEGQPVKRGQLLFTIDPGPGQAGMEQAQAALRRDNVVAANAAAEAKRYAGLLRQGFVTREQTEQLQANAAAAQATLAADRATVANARITLGYTTIKAPIDGIAGALQVNVGNLVKSADQTPLVVINQVRPIFVTFSVPEAQVDEVKRYQGSHPLAVEARPRGGAPATGTLTFLDNAVDQTTGTLKMKASFPNPDGRLVPGEYVDVLLTLAVTDAITVPPQAVMTGQQGTFVFVIAADNTVAVRPVKVGRQTGDIAVIADGLQPGEKVVTDGQLQLVPGAKVRLREELAPPANEQGQPKSGRGEHGASRAAGTKL
jgi:multidrug efflux system membrane fusion protein